MPAGTNLPFMRLLIADRPEKKRRFRDSAADDANEEAEIGEENELGPA